MHRVQFGSTNRGYADSGLIVKTTDCPFKDEAMGVPEIGQREVVSVSKLWSASMTCCSITAAPFHGQCLILSETLVRCTEKLETRTRIVCSSSEIPARTEMSERSPSFKIHIAHEL
jgi:hypothetical protein